VFVSPSPAWIHVEYRSRITEHKQLALPLYFIARSDEKADGRNYPRLLPAAIAFSQTFARTRARPGALPVPVPDGRHGLRPDCLGSRASSPKPAEQQREHENQRGARRQAGAPPMCHAILCYWPLLPSSLLKAKAPKPNPLSPAGSMIPVPSVAFASRGNHTRPAM